MTEVKAKPVIDNPLNGGKLKEIMSLKAFKIAVSLVILLIVIIIIVAATASNKVPTTIISADAVIKITDQGFQPATELVKVGTKVIWTNTDPSHNVVIASNPYPSDNSLPSLKSTQLGNNASYSYVFNRVGTYTYHDDLNPTLTATIKVQK